MPRDKGFTLLELMVSLTIFVLFTGAFFSAWQQLQLGSADLASLFERDQNLYLSTLLLSRWLPPAGNHHQHLSQSGVTGGPNTLEVTGDIDGPSGFPDASLNQSFERIALRQRNDALQLRSGRGSFQSLIEGISDFQITPAASSTELTLESNAASLRNPEKENTRSVAARFFLWNYRINLFAKKP